MESIALWRRASRVVSGSLFIFLCTTTSTRGADDSKAPPAPAPHVTQSLRVKSPSVTVRANPAASQNEKQGSGQYAFIDENGALTSTPPADFEFPSIDPAPAANPVPRRSAVDPNATLIDTSHIHAVLRAKVDPNGKTTLECFHSADPALQESCTKPHTTSAPESIKTSAAVEPEDGQ